MLVDIIIVVIIGLSIVIGIARGFANTVIGLVSIILSLVIAFFLCGPVANLLSNVTQIDENVRSKVIRIVPMNDQDVEIDVNTNSVPEPIQNSINATVSNATNTINEKKDEIVNSAADSITSKIMDAIAFIILFIALRIILLIINLVTQIAKQQEFIDKVDKLLGFLFGLLRGILIIYTFLGVVRVCEPIVANDYLIDNIEDSKIGSFVYEHNFIANAIEDLTK